MTGWSVAPESQVAAPFRPASALFRAQVQLTGAVALIVCITLVLPGGELLDGPAFFFGLTTILWVATMVTTVPWSRIDPHWQMAVPLVDMVAIATFRLSAPQSGFGILLAFPVIWLCASFGRAGTIVGPAFGCLLVWTQVLADQLGWLPMSVGPQNPTAATSLSLTMVFIAAVIHSTNRRDAAQRILLRRQTNMVEQALKRARIGETTLREVLDAVEFAVVGMDPQGRVLTSNRATRALLRELELPAGTTPDNLPFYAADKVTPVARNDLPHRRAMRGETIDGEKYWIGHLTGVRVAVSVSARVLQSGDGSVDRIVVAAHDITAETRAIQDRDDLVTSMSHELRTPLSSILGYVDLTLEDEELSVESRQMLEIAFTNTQRIMELVGDLLAARSTGPLSAMMLRPAECDLTDIVGESIAALRVLASDRIVTLALDAPDRAPLVGDAFRLRQVVDNLLSNAIKYNELGGRVYVTLAHDVPEEGWLSLTVTDSGRGMTAEEQKGLFARFYRAESVRGTTIHGSGLGLSICREIVELHHGEIDVASEPGRGTVVTVRLPLDALVVPGHAAVSA